MISSDAPANNDIAIESYGDSARLVRTSTSNADTREWLHRTAEALSSTELPGVEGLVATYDSLLVEYDPYLTCAEQVDARIRGCVTDAAPVEARVHRVPALYGGDHGPDLGGAAAELGLSVAQFIEAHSSVSWTVAFRGAPAGAPMLDGAPFDRPIRRCAQPRVRVPAGSIAVAGLQGVIYPVPSPGGWRLVARTPLNVIDIRHDPHLLYRPGDLFEFFPITESEAGRFSGTLLGTAGV